MDLRRSLSCEEGEPANVTCKQGSGTSTWLRHLPWSAEAVRGVEAHVLVDVKELLQRPGASVHAEESQGHVPHEEHLAYLVGRAVLHPLLEAENDGHVGYDDEKDVAPVRVEPPHPFRHGEVVLEGHGKGVCDIVIARARGGLNARHVEEITHGRWEDEVKLTTLLERKVAGH